MKSRSKVMPIKPHSLLVKTGLTVAKSAGADPVPPWLYCTVRISPPLRVTNKWPEPSGAHAMPVAEFKLDELTKVFSVKFTASRTVGTNRSSSGSTASRQGGAGLRTGLRTTLRDSVKRFHSMMRRPLATRVWNFEHDTWNKSKGGHRGP